MLPLDAGTTAVLTELHSALATLAGSPPEARRRLRRRLMDYLQSGPSALRAFAAEGLGRVGDDQALPLLIAALHDPHPLVQWNAAHALRDLSAHGLVAPSTLAFDDGAAFQAWKQALVDRLLAELAAPDPQARREAAAILTELDLAAALPALVAALPDPDPQVYATLRHALVRIIGPAPERFALALPAIDALLHHADPTARVAVAALLGDLGVRDTWAGLAQLLHDADPRVRAGAAHALGRLRAPAAGAGLQAALVDDAPAVRSAAAWALGALGDRYAVPALLQVAADEDPTVRRAVVGALAALAVPAGLPVLLAALAADDPALRYQAAVGLGRLRDRRALKPLAAARRDPRPVAGTTVGDAAAAAIRAIRAISEA
jgi:HEAT repeat protein